MLQLTLLDNYEVWLRRFNGLTADVPLTLLRPSTSTGDSSFTTTAQLEERIQHLKQHLVLPLAAASDPSSTRPSCSQASASAADSVPDATSGAAAAAVDAARAAAAAAGCQANGDQTNNMARWFQSVTPEDVAAMNGFTVESIASRWHPVHGSCSQPQLFQSVGFLHECPQAHACLYDVLVCSALGAP
jgi:hypothetical protein